MSSFEIVGIVVGVVLLLILSIKFGFLEVVLNILFAVLGSSSSSSSSSSKSSSSDKDSFGGGSSGGGGSSSDW